VIVFPTPVGVNLFMNLNAQYTVSFPHTRGGEPSASIQPGRSFRFSPHPWG